MVTSAFSRRASLCALTCAAALLAACSSPPKVSIDTAALKSSATSAVTNAIATKALSAATASKIAAPSGSKLAMKVPAVGVQIYRCTRTDGKLGWTFVSPEADLFDERGKLIGKHGAGPFWEMFDGSKVIGAVAQREDSTRPGAIAHLLLTTTSTGGAGSNPGTVANIKHIQRVNTLGGAAPANGCAVNGDIDRQARVYYSADYHFYE